MDDQSIWKKEISFGRKRKPAQPEPEDKAAESAPDEPTSIWKKELSFGRKKKPAEVVTPPEDTDASGDVQGSKPEPGPEETAPEEEQVWTRAVNFGRQQDEETVAEPEIEAPAPVETVAEEAAVAADASGDVQGSKLEPGPEETAPEEEQVWRRAAAEVTEPEPVVEAPAPVEAVADEAEVVVEASGEVQGSDPETGPEGTAPEEQVWTRAVSFGRKREEESEPAAEVTEPEPVVEAPAPVEPVADEAEVVVDGSGGVQGSEPETGPEETVPAEQVWTKAVSFSPSGESEPEPAPVVDATEAPTETWSAAPALSPERAPVPQPEPVAVHPPVPASELPPDPEQKVPFWKKDISFGGGKKREKAPKALRAAKQPKQPKQPRERKQKQPKVKAPRGHKGAKRLVGLKIGASQLAAARVSNNGAAELLQVAREPLEPGIVVGGELRDPDALAAALKEFFARHNLPKKGVRLGIANNRIGVRTFEIAGIDDPKQLTNAIRFRAQEALPIPIDEAVLDYQVLGEGVDEEGHPTKRILLVVAYRELIDRYMDACKKAGIGLVGIDLEAFALLRALQAPQDGVGSDPSAALVAVAIGHERSTFAVSDGRICEFTRVLEWGGAALNVAIARAVDAAPSEVEGAKRALALTDEMVPEGLTAEQAKKARDAMRRAIQTFARELVSSLQYYQNQPGSLGIGEIALTGGTAHLPGLAGELERLIGVRVRVGDPLARMKVSKKLGETEQIGSLAVAIGLGIED